MTDQQQSRRAGTEPALAAYIAALGAGALLLTVLLAGRGAEPPGTPAWAALPVLGGLVLAAEHFTVRFRYGREVDALNLVEAVLAPLLFAFPGAYVVGTVAAAHAVAAFPRRNAPVKALFNVAQWSLAAGAGAAVVTALSRGSGITARNVGALLVALAVVLLTNQIAFTFVLAIANHQRPRDLLRGLAPVIVPGWLGGWVINVLIGLLYVLAYAAHPAAVVLFAVPLVVLHLAYRGYAAARTDRQRLSGLHRAAQALAAPLDPRDAIRPFLQQVLAAFEARAAELVLKVDGGREVHRAEAGDAVTVSFEPDGSDSLAARVSAAPGALRITAGARDPLAQALAAAGSRDCLAAPLLDDGRLIGALLVLDQAGIESASSGELAVLDALAREAADAFAKGRLLASVLEERRKLAEIVSTTSDGLLTLAADGTVRSWNPALERITGLPAADVVGTSGVLASLSPRTVTGKPVDLAAWAGGVALPHDLRITTVEGSPRRLSCSYSQAYDDDGAARTLVVVARDITPAEEMEALRAQFTRLVEAEATQRLVVEHLQQTVMPARPEVAGVDLGIAYLGSDPSAPTGGDLYDWQVLPSGEVHVAVVDVLGHGMAATKDALAVVHTLRTVAVDGTPLDQLVVRAHALLAAQNPELVATVIVGRFDPESGRVQVVAGGHPPALVVTRGGEVTQLAATGGAIGWPGAGSDAAAEAVLDVDDALVLYTDGLVEARKNILDGMDSLVRHASAVAHLPATAFAGELLDRALAGAERRDDSLVLVLRRTPVAAGGTVRRWQSTPEVSSVTRVRRELVAWLAEQGVHTDDAALVVSELVANAVAVARSTVTTHVELSADHVVVEVTDDGVGNPALEQAGRVLPHPEKEYGRGIFLVRTLSEEVSILSAPEGSAIRAVLPRRPATIDLRVRDRAGC